jgi:hypothetical protein
MSDRPRFDSGFDFSNAAIAQSSQACGRPINHLLCAGSNWPPLSIPAEEPISSSPEAVNRAGWSVVTMSTVFRLLSLFPASLLPFRAGVPAIGVGQPARCSATDGSDGLNCPTPSV